MARANVFKPVGGLEVGDAARSRTFYTHRHQSAHLVALIDFDLLGKAATRTPSNHPLNSPVGLTALRVAAGLRLSHVVSALGIARTVSIDIVDIAGGAGVEFIHERNSVTEFPIGVYVQSGAGQWGDPSRGEAEGYLHPSRGADRIIASAWKSNGLQLASVDKPYEREALRYSLVCTIEDVYGTSISAWLPTISLPGMSRYLDIYSEVGEDGEKLRFIEDCKHMYGHVLCSNLLGFAVPGERRVPGVRVWSFPDVVMDTLESVSARHGCDEGDVRDIAIWMDSSRADYDPIRAADHAGYDQCVDVAESFGLEYDRVELARLCREADGDTGHLSF